MQTLDHAHELNLKTSDALLTMPKLREFAFCPVHHSGINLCTFLERTGGLPDGSHQVYALDTVKLDVLINYSQPRILDTFAYTLNVSPISPRTVWAVVTSIPAAAPEEPDPIIALHAPGMAERTVGLTVVHFVDEGRMKDFANKIAFA